MDRIQEIEDAIKNETDAYWEFNGRDDAEFLISAINTIIKAAKPFTGLLCKTDSSLPDDFTIYYDSNKTAITVGDMRTLFLAIKRIKEEKG